MNAHTLKVLEYHKIISILASFSSSDLGRERIKNLEPFTDLNKIEKLIAETTAIKNLLHPGKSLPISGLSDISAIISKLDNWSDVLNAEEINQIRAILTAARLIKECLLANNQYQNLTKISESINTFSELEETIERIFEQNGEIKDNASSHLKSIRKNIQIKKKRVNDKMSSLVRSGNVGIFLQDEHIRENQNRPTIAVISVHAGKVKGTKRGTSDSGKTIFIEPDSIKRLGDELEAAVYDEKLEMQKLLHEITSKIADRVKDLVNTVEILTHLDMTYAKVRFSRKFDMRPPILNTNGVINLKAASHPLLLELQDCEESGNTIPIDVRLGDDFQTLIVTGPNTGGKTVALKTVGLLTLMAQSGMHIPAGDNSQLAVFEKVWADIGDEQSIEQSLSTFSSHLTHVAEILNNSNKNSLVLLDELGGGTDPSEGEALAEAILDYLHKRQTRTIVTTHISQLKNLGYTVKGFENASIEFDLETLCPTYRLLIGIPGGSNALSLAKRLGLPEEVLKRAASQKRGEAGDLMNQLQAARSRIAENQSITEKARIKAEILQNEAIKSAAELQRQLERAKDKSGENSKKTLTLVKSKIEALLEKEPSKKTLLKALSEIINLLTIGSGPVQKPGLKIDDKVRVKSLNKVGVLVSLNHRQKSALVSIGSMQVDVTQNDLVFIKSS